MAKEYALGRNPSAPFDLARRLRLRNYISRELSATPPITSWRTKAPKSLAKVFGNDRYGTCTVAAAGHSIGVWTANASQEHVFDDQALIDIYFKLSGGRDSGLSLPTVLKYWQKTGIMGHTCGPYLAVDIDFDKVCTAIALFGPVYAAFTVPSSWKDDEIWDKCNTRLGGGHCVSFVDYDKDYIYVSTWGEIRKLTRAGLNWVFDEAYIVLDPDWMDNPPNGLNTYKLQQDFIELGGDPGPLVFPPVITPPEPPPAPPEPPPAPPEPDVPPAPVPTPIDWVSLLNLILAILGAFNKKDEK